MRFFVSLRSSPGSSPNRIRSSVLAHRFWSGRTDHDSAAVRWALVGWRRRLSSAEAAVKVEAIAVARVSRGRWTAAVWVLTFLRAQRD